MEYHTKKTPLKSSSPSSHHQQHNQSLQNHQSLQNYHNHLSQTTQENENDENQYKLKDNSVENAKKLKEYIENKDIESLSNLLNTENIPKGTLNIGLCLALPKYYNNNKNQDIIECLLNIFLK